MKRKEIVAGCPTPPPFQSIMHVCACHVNYLVLSHFIHRNHIWIFFFSKGARCVFGEGVLHFMVLVSAKTVTVRKNDCASSLQYYMLQKNTLQPCILSDQTLPTQNDLPTAECDLFTELSTLEWVLGNGMMITENHYEEVQSSMTCYKTKVFLWCKRLILL